MTLNSARTLQDALRLSELEIDDILDCIGIDNFEKLITDWPLWARDDQLPGEVISASSDWKTWIVLGGRGAGKTMTGAQWIRYQALGKNPLLPTQQPALLLLAQRWVRPGP